MKQVTIYTSRGDSVYIVNAGSVSVSDAGVLTAHSPSYQPMARFENGFWAGYTVEESEPAAHPDSVKLRAVLDALGALQDPEGRIYGLAEGPESAALYTVLGVSEMCAPICPQPKPIDDCPF